jgi:xanthine dehydrogenase large subunit
MSVGKPKPHESAAFHVSGGAIYTDDQRPIHGLLSCWPVMAPHAHAKILKIDVSKAYDVSGVVSVLDPADVPGVNDSSGHHHDEILLPNTEVLYWGQAVTWVVAETEETARLGAEKVLVEYEKLGPILSIEKAIEANSFHSDTLRIARGDTSAALETSPHVITDEVYVGGQDHFYLETQTSWVIPDGEGHFHVYSSTQHPSETQTVVARVLGIPRNNVVVTAVRMGGGFGGKESQANPYAAIAALAAHKTGRPVRIRLKRDQDMILTGKRHPFLGRYKVGFDDEGKLLALDLDLYSDGGWSSDLSEPVLARAMFHSDNCYYIPNMDVRGRVAKTNKTSQTAFRGFGGPQGMVVIETIVDRVARQLGLAPEIVREKNFYHGSGETSTTHYGQEIIDNRIQRIWDEVKTQSEFDKRKNEITVFNGSSPYKKRGLAITPVKFGISFTHTILNQAGALVLIYTDGSIQVNHGGTEMGQGLHVKMLQVAAKTLGVNFDRFRMMPTATDKVPNTSATAASSGADLNGQAVKNACDILKTRLAEVAAKMLNLNAPEDMAFEDDFIFSSQHPVDRVKFDDVVAQAYLWQVSLFANGYYRTPNIYWDKHKGKGKPFFYYAYGASVSEVEVDGLTGQWKLRQVDIVHDVGESLNPLIDKGQIEGGFVQGMGWLTMEELVWDNEGRLRTHAPSTYKIPTIAEIPEKFSVHLLERASQVGVIYGSKAVGEPPLMLPISVREALRDAVAAFGKANHVSLAAPATPEAILLAVENVKTNSKALVPGD